MFDCSKQGAVEVIAGRDSLNGEACGDLNGLVEGLLRQGQPRVVVDLARVPLMDGTGLEWLLDLEDQCRRRGGAVKLAAPSPLCRDILTVTGLDEQFEVFDAVLDAVGSFAL